jgi:AcrR family transcriptional regulator
MALKSRKAVKPKPAASANKRRLSPSKAPEPNLDPAHGLIIDSGPRTAGARLISPRARQIYLQAARLFVEKGYDGTSMSDIAEAVNITKAGLYHFVKSKEDLLFILVTYGMDELEVDVVTPALAEPDPGVRLRLIIRNHLANLGRVHAPQGNPVTIVTNDISGLSPENQRAVNARKRAYYDLVRRTLDELKARGDVAADLDTGVAAHSIIGAILWTDHWRRPGGRLSVEQIVDQLTRFILNGVLIR